MSLGGITKSWSEEVFVAGCSDSVEKVVKGILSFGVHTKSISMMSMFSQLFSACSNSKATSASSIQWS